MANFNIPYSTEQEGQMEFFDSYGVPYNDDASVLVDNTDGIFNGCIFEFKLNISSLNRTLFQAIKYLSKMRVKGESVPATILLIDLNATTVYVYRSVDYFDHIHKVYTGAASKDNDNFIAGPCIGKYDYSDMLQSSQVKKILRGRKSDPDEMYMPVDIDENCIVGWAERYYDEKPNASKGDFLGDETGTAVKVTGEIREPKHFKGLIRPYTGKTNERFRYLMDCLNDRLSKKDLGAFYTPVPYAKKAAELVQMAVDRVPDGNDYIILDRCAGTGNLEAALIGLYDRNGDELIGHCVISTYEYYEYKVLSERIGDKVREIIPPSEANVVYENGRVANADAMSKEYIENPIIRQYVDDSQCTIILFENPPYQDSSAISYNDDEGKRGKTGRKDTYVCTEYKANITALNEAKGSFREISNLFIWSGFRYFLRQETDSYIIFSPIKYWKTIGLGEHSFHKGFIFNRRHFHATDSTITCIYWGNKPDTQETITLDCYDIQNPELVFLKQATVKKAHNTYLPYYDKRTFPTDVETTVCCGRDGEEDTSHKVDGKILFNDNIIGYVRTINYSPDAMNRVLTRQLYFGARGYYLRNDVYLKKLPLFVSKCVPLEEWYDKDLYYNTSDGGDAYTNDPQFLKSCLIYTCLSNQNKCLSFDGSDGRRYQNELCFDDSKAEKPLALQDLEKYAASKATVLDDEEEMLLEVWRQILTEARKTTGYDAEFNYGVYQITKELNTFKVEGSGKNKRKVYDHPVLNGHLDTLRVMLKAYYKSHITAKMFKYELLK